jgi:hypothetical protein
MNWIKFESTNRIPICDYEPFIIIDSYNDISLVHIDANNDIVKSNINDFHDKMIGEVKYYLILPNIPQEDI